jgi:hypothetical protein
MVETPMIPRPTPRSPWLSVALALLAVTFLALMAGTGKISETRQLAKFTARGVLKVLPDRVQRVTVTVGERTAMFIRHPEYGWIYSDSQRTVSAELQEHLTLAVLLLHGSGPLRVMPREEYSDMSLQEFGLAQARYSVVLADAHSTLLEAHFGSFNPQELLQYMRLTGNDQVYLMSRFVGQAWEHIWEHASAATAAP